MHFRLLKFSRIGLGELLKSSSFVANVPNEFGRYGVLAPRFPAEAGVFALRQTDPLSGFHADAPILRIVVIIAITQALEPAES